MTQTQSATSGSAKPSAPDHRTAPTNQHPLDRVHHALPLQAAMIAQIANACIITAVLFRQSHAVAFLSWMLVSSGVAAFILFDWSRRAKKRLPRLTSPRFQARSMQFASFLGAMWALLAIALLGELRPNEELALIAVLVCTCSIGAVLLSAMPKVAITYASTILLPVVLACFLVLPSMEYAGLGALLLAYWGFLMGLIRIWSRLIDTKAQVLDELHGALAARDHIENVASTDQTTGLPNRRSIVRILAEREATHRPDEPGTYALLVIDLNRFRTVNETLGRDIGDALLKKIGARLVTHCGPNAIVARLAGDEFAVITDRMADAAAICGFAHTINAALDQPFRVEEHDIMISASIGIATADQHVPGSRELHVMADIAVCAAKSAGAARVRLYEPALGEDLDRRLSIEAALRHAVDRNELSLCYQPIYDLTTRDLVGLEAFMRWEHDGHAIAPSMFLPVAESNGMIVSLGYWALRKACLEACSWPSHLRLTVNLSTTQIFAPHLVDTLAKILAETGLAPDRLELDIPEGVILKHAEITLRRLQRLKALGVTLVLDDFGKGDVSLLSVSRYPIDKIKLDRSLLAEVGDCSRGRAAITATITLARALGLGIMAEGIESSSDLAAVDKFTQLQGQGYFLGRPQSPQDMAAEIAEVGRCALADLSAAVKPSIPAGVAAE